MPFVKQTWTNGQTFDATAANRHEDGIAEAILAAGGGAAAQTINAQTSTTYTLVASDAGKIVTLTNAAAITLTVPGSVFTAGQRIDCIVLGAGKVTVTGTGVNGTPSLVSRAQYSAFTVVALTPTTFVVVGDLT